jgi:pSer/pThr/pTyr-binding forkhead associated (FHA) protein
MRSWVIGSQADCDVVVDSPLVSARHCQLTQIPEGFVLNDLESTNGTFVDGVRITSPTRVTPGESITLGRTLLMPWPPGVLTFVRIGRAADNDIVVDDPRVSSHHARLIMVDGGRTMIEDVGSSNGTFLNSAERRVTGPKLVTETDTLYFGTMAVAAARLLAGQNALAASASVPHSQASGPSPGHAAILTLPATASLAGNRRTAAALTQVPIIAILIVLVFGRQAAATVTASSRASIEHALASTTFALALAAVWFGCSLAVGEVAAGRLSRRQSGDVLPKALVSFGSRLVARCCLGCAALLALVYWGSGLKGPWPAMWGMLVMASLVGLLLGYIATAFVPKAGRKVFLLACFSLMLALGGRIWPVHQMSSPFRLAAAAMPTRWALEGLLLLETNEHPASVVSVGSDPDQPLDFAEGFFPIDTERMGPRADVLALGSMQIGLAAVAAFFWGHWQSAS